jgi:hypothetical protein
VVLACRRRCVATKTSAGIPRLDKSAVAHMAHVVLVMIVAYLLRTGTDSDRHPLGKPHGPSSRPQHANQAGT